MKPHIFKRHGLWYCRLRCETRASAGVGYTPAHAYSDWYEINRKVKRA